MRTLSGVWVEAIGGYVVAQRAAGRSLETVRLRESQLRRFAGWVRVGPWEVTPALLMRWMGESGWARETLRSHRAGVRGFYGWAVAMGHLEASPAAALPPVRPSPPRPRPTPDLAYRRALADAREWEGLALRLGAEAGLRRGEIVQVHADDLSEDLGGWSLLVHGKGSKFRTVPLTADLARAVRVACRIGGGYAFPGQVDGHLSPSYLAKRVSALLPEGVTTHSLRHRFATRVHAATRDVFVVQELLGHASPETTRRYVEVNRDALRQAVEAIAA